MRSRTSSEINVNAGYEPLAIDNLPVRLLFNQSPKLILVRNLIVNAGLLGRFEIIPILEEKYEEAAGRILNLYIGGLKETAKLGEMVDKANMWKEAGLAERWRDQLEAAREFDATRRQEFSQPPTPVTQIIEEELDKAQRQAGSTSPAR